MIKIKNSDHFKVIYNAVDGLRGKKSKTKIMSTHLTWKPELGNRETRISDREGYPNHFKAHFRSVCPGSFISP